MGVRNETLPKPDRFGAEQQSLSREWFDLDYAHLLRCHVDENTWVFLHSNSANVNCHCYSTHA